MPGHRLPEGDRPLRPPLAAGAGALPSLGVAEPPAVPGRHGRRGLVSQVPSGLPRGGWQLCAVPVVLLRVLHGLRPGTRLARALLPELIRLDGCLSPWGWGLSDRPLPCPHQSYHPGENCADADYKLRLLEARSKGRLMTEAMRQEFLKKRQEILNEKLSMDVIKQSTKQCPRQVLFGSRRGARPASRVSHERCHRGCIGLAPPSWWR